MQSRCHIEKVVTFCSLTARTDMAAEKPKRRIPFSVLERRLASVDTSKCTHSPPQAPSKSTMAYDEPHRPCQICLCATWGLV